MYCTLCRNNDPIIELLRVISHGGKCVEELLTHSKKKV